MLIVDVGSFEYRARYMEPSGRHMKGLEFYRAAMAEVGKLKDEFFNSICRRKKHHYKSMDFGWWISIPQNGGFIIRGCFTLDPVHSF